MKIIQKIKEYRKKRYIRNEIKGKFKSLGKELNKHNREYINHLTNSLFKSSIGVKAMVLNAEREAIEYEDELLYGDIKAVIEKHYNEREEKLKKENEKLARELKEKNKKINQIKSKITETVSSN
jgi:hypothetical protein